MRIDIERKKVAELERRISELQKGNKSLESKKTELDKRNKWLEEEMIGLRASDENLRRENTFLHDCIRSNLTQNLALDGRAMVDDQIRALGCSAHDGAGIGAFVDEYEYCNPESDLRRRYNYRKAQNGYAHNREIGAAAYSLLYVQNFVLDTLSDNDFIRYEYNNSIFEEIIGMTAKEVVESPPGKIELFTAPGKFGICSIADREAGSTFALNRSQYTPSPRYIQSVLDVVSQPYSPELYHLPEQSTVSSFQYSYYGSSCESTVPAPTESSPPSDFHYNPEAQSFEFTPQESSSSSGFDPNAQPSQFSPQSATSLHVGLNPEAQSFQYIPPSPSSAASSVPSSPVTPLSSIEDAREIFKATILGVSKSLKEEKTNTDDSQIEADSRLEAYKAELTKRLFQYSVTQRAEEAKRIEELESTESGTNSRRVRSYKTRPGKGLGPGRGLGCANVEPNSKPEDCLV